MGKLEGRVGLITGAATGIGRAGVALFAAEGAAMVALDVNAMEGGRAIAEVEAGGGRAIFVHGDVSREADVRRAVETAVERFGKLDLLWSNAGIGVWKTVPETTDEVWRTASATPFMP